MTQQRFDELTLEDAVEEARAIVARAKAEHDPVSTVVLFSGGNDSSVLLHLAADAVGGPRDGVLHCNTTMGVEETREFARARVHDLGLRFFEFFPRKMPHPRDRASKSDASRERNERLARRLEEERIDWDDLTAFEQYVSQLGFPGPGHHRWAYIMLKDRALRSFLKHVVPGRGKVVLLAGVRAHESQRRMGTALEVKEEGRLVWVNPIIRFTDALMAEYRTTHDLPRNEVSDHLHMSGECLCGAFAKPGELEGIRFFYPEVAAQIDAAEALVRRLGHPQCKWGAGGAMPKGPSGPMCASCDQLELAWQECPA